MQTDIAFEEVESCFNDLRQALVSAEQLEKDAARYRRLKSRKGLMLQSKKQPNIWKRTDGTGFSATHFLAEDGIQYGPVGSLDELIDNAILTLRKNHES